MLSPVFISFPVLPSLEEEPNFLRRVFYVYKTVLELMPMLDKGKTIQVKIGDFIMAKRVGIAEAAEALGLSITTIRRGYKSGRFPGIRSGEGVGKLLFDVEQLERILEKESWASVPEKKAEKADERALEVKKYNDTVHYLRECGAGKDFVYIATDNTARLHVFVSDTHFYTLNLTPAYTPDAEFAGIVERCKKKYAEETGEVRA